ncbi:SHOCT-like domain-containing protein [Phenylobacterium montanum]|uniref:YvlB/LiaX N-terminal domain-containing protein n=1 Tax=Phenylobacterium montanum TaxID=2823693 RepID=A0A975FV11_9CAUL|nr:hypothetical protein [Caulobacter sp. S6]QUD85993.1 hypothetical protein KCG34_12835 [Caulobacter sp. S6]
MHEERRRILQMLADQKITADEAERLIGALSAEPAAPTSEPPGRKPKYLRVLVDTDETEEGPTKVNIRVPMQLLRAGVRLGALIPVHAREPVNRALSQQGIDFDVGQIKPENLEELVEQLSDLTVDVDQERTKVRVFCE